MCNAVIRYVAIKPATKELYSPKKKKINNKIKTNKKKSCGAEEVADIPRWREGEKQERIKKNAEKSNIIFINIHNNIVIVIMYKIINIIHLDLSKRKYIMIKKSKENRQRIGSWLQKLYC